MACLICPLALSRHSGSRVYDQGRKPLPNYKKGIDCLFLGSRPNEAERKTRPFSVYLRMSLGEMFREKERNFALEAGRVLQEETATGPPGRQAPGPKNKRRARR